MQKICEEFPGIATRVQQDHERVHLSGGHDFMHAFRVGEMARRIALDEWGDEDLSHLSGVAGLTHNADRVIQKELGIGREPVDIWRTLQRTREWIGGDLQIAELAKVQGAVLHHSEINNDADEKELISLKDADRVVNLAIDIVPRSAQHYSDLAVVDYDHFLSNPDATYHDPGSVLRDIAYSLDWVDPTSKVCVRTRLGREIGDARAQILHVFLATLRDQLEEEGVGPSYKN